MQINFFDDPNNQPRSRKEVRINRIGLIIQEEQRRITFGIELTPFLERPCIEVQIMNGLGQPAGSLNVIETVESSFSLVMHLRDDAVYDPYTLSAEIYYVTPETDRVKVDKQEVAFEISDPGEKIFVFNEL